MLPIGSMLKTISYNYHRKKMIKRFKNLFKVIKQSTKASSKPQEVQLRKSMIKNIIKITLTPLNMMIRKLNRLKEVANNKSKKQLQETKISRRVNNHNLIPNNNNRPKS